MNFALGRLCERNEAIQLGFIQQNRSKLLRCARKDERLALYDQTMFLPSIVRTFVFIFLAFCLPTFATQVPDSNLGKPWFTKIGLFSPQIYVDLYLSSSCPNCLSADQFFKALEQQQSWVIVKRHWIDKDISALKQFNRELKSFNYEGGYLVPSIFFCQTHWVGFNDVQLSGKLLLKGLNACFTSIYQFGDMTAPVLGQLQRWSKENMVLSHVDSTSEITWSELVIQSAFLDAITPCSFFVIMAFLAMLGITKKSAWSTAWVGGLFIFIIATIHFFQLLHWDRYSIWLTNLQPVARVVGVLLVIWLLYILWREYKKTYEPKPYLIGVITAWAVYSYQQQCAFAFPSFYEFWMTSHNISRTAILASTLLYQILYLSILGVFLGLIILYGIPKQKLFSRISWLALLVIGGILIWSPSALSNAWLSMVMLLIVVIMGIIWHKVRIR